MYISIAFFLVFHSMSCVFMVRVHMWPLMRVQSFYTFHLSLQIMGLNFFLLVVTCLKKTNVLSIGDGDHMFVVK